MKTVELMGIAHELKFWQGFVKTPRFLNGWVARVKTPELNQDVYDFIKSVPHGKVLDVGSGVCSILNGTVPGVITADPLGNLYQLIFDYARHGMHPPLAVPAEELEYKSEFDIVHISNALDHTQDPDVAYHVLLRAVRPGGYLIVQGFENEGSFESWQGFHKWNLFVKDEELIMEDEVGCMARIGIDPMKVVKRIVIGKTWYIWIKQKQ